MATHSAHTRELEATTREAVLPSRKHIRRLQALLARTGAVRVPGASPVSPNKAREILRHGEVHGRRLTKAQRGLFGLIAGGRRPTRVKA